MKRDISKLITLSFITLISVSIVFLSKKIKNTENIKNFFLKMSIFIPYLKNKNDKIENELGI